MSDKSVIFRISYVQYKINKSFLDLFSNLAYRLYSSKREHQYIGILIRPTFLEVIADQNNDILWLETNSDNKISEVI